MHPKSVNVFRYLLLLLHSPAVQLRRRSVSGQLAAPAVGGGLSQTFYLFCLSESRSLALNTMIIIFSCPSTSRPTLVTHVYFIVLDSKPSRQNPQPRKSDWGHEKT